MSKKNIVILGATCELGKEISLIYAKNNYNLILISRNLKKIQDLANTIQNKFPEVHVDIYELNILNLDKQIKVYDELKNKSIDGVISCIGETHNIDKVNEKKLIDIININFTYLVCFLSFFLEDFEKKNNGFLICISSVAGLRGRGKNFIYGSAKAALTTFMSGCRNYFNNTNIFIMTVLPGFIIRNKDLNTPKMNLLSIKPSNLAQKIFLAHKEKKQILYSSFIWRVIMNVIRILPNKIFNKIKF